MSHHSAESSSSLQAGSDRQDILPWSDVYVPIWTTPGWSDDAVARTDTYFESVILLKTW